MLAAALLACWTSAAIPAIAADLPAPAAPAAATLGRRQLSSNYHWDGRPAIRVAFFDSDSTLRVSLSGQVSANGPRDVMVLPGVPQKLGELARQGYLIAVVSNQGGIPKWISLEDADAAFRYTIELIRQGGGEVHYYDFAENAGQDRKPGIGMALRLEALLKERFGPDAHIDKTGSFMVGDSAYQRAKDGQPADLRPDGTPGTDFSDSDRLFAANLGVRFVEPADFFGWAKYGVHVFANAAEAQSFAAAHP